MSAPLVEVEEVTFGRGGEALIEGATFSVTRGEVFAILGRSGSGKTTLLDHLIGLERPMQGRIRVGGRDPRELIALDEPPCFGVSFQSGGLFGSLSLRQNLALPLRTWTDLPREAIDLLVDVKLRLVGLAGAGDLFPNELSGGMAQRARIARGLMLEPELLVVDEPTGNLDPPTARELDDLLLELNEALGMTLIIVTHELGTVFRVVQRCVLLDRQTSSIRAEGDPREMRKSEDEVVREFFSAREEASHAR